MVETVDFGKAIEALKQGKRVARDWWFAMFLYYVPANRYPYSTEAGKAISGEDGKVEYGAYIAWKTVNNNVIPWSSNVDDILAEDWVIID